jgi:hypothetical protein
VLLQSLALANQLSEYRAQAAAKIASLAGRPSLEPAARQELEELTLVLQAALAQVCVEVTMSGAGVAILPMGGGECVSGNMWWGVCREGVNHDARGADPGAAGSFGTGV